MSHPLQIAHHHAAAESLPPDEKDSHSHIIPEILIAQ